MSVDERESLRVVLDTNVFFSAFIHPGGVPFEMWQSAIRRRYILLTSPAILRELAGVLREDANWSEPNLVAQLKLMARVAQMVVPKKTLDVVAEDPDDNRIIECATEGRADLIVSGDRHLLRLKSYRGIGIIRPVDFRRILER